MFSEYASRYLSKSQRPVPLFNRTSAGDSDVDDYIEAMSDSTEDGSSSSEPGSSSLHSESESEYQSHNDTNPPNDLLVERPKHKKKKASKHKTGYSLWKRNNVESWSKGAAQSSISHPEAGSSLSISSHMNSNISSSHIPTHSDHVAQVGENNAHTRGDLEAGLKRGKPLDNTVAAFYLLLMACALATAFLVSLSAVPNPGTIYPIFAYSVRPLVIYAVIACAISMLWLLCMRHFTRATIHMLHGFVPASMASLATMTLFSSVHKAVGRHGLAHAAMRVSAILVIVIVVLYIMQLRRYKDVQGRAADLVVLTVEVYNECTPLMTVLTLSSGIVSLVVTGLWSFFLARAFLDGRLGVLLGIWYTFMYFWTWGIMCALLRAILTSVTMEWYLEHSMKNVLSKSIYEAIAYHFSSACLSALIALLVKLPLLLLPSRLSGVYHGAASAFLSSPTSSLLSPLALPTAVINRCSLNSAAHAICAPEFVSLDRRPYRFAKFYLVSARVCCTIAIGLVAWMHADHLQDASSAYGYLVAVIALFIGWTVMGASENMLSMISDALLVNYVINDDSPKRQQVSRLFVDFSSESSAAAENMMQSEYSDSLSSNSR